MAKIDTLFMTKTAEKSIPFGPPHTYIAHIREYSSPGQSTMYLSKHFQCNMVFFNWDYWSIDLPLKITFRKS